MALRSADGIITAFQQAWSRDSRSPSYFYCPDYRPDDPSSAPRSLITAAIDVPGGLNPTSLGSFKNAISVAPYRGEDLQNATTISMRTDTAIELPLNSGCSSRARFVDESPPGYFSQQTFAIDEKRYFLGSNQPVAAVCDSNNVYLYYFWLNNDKQSCLLYIQRRQLENFSKVWSLVTKVNYARPKPLKGKPNIKIRSLHEDAGVVVAEIVDVEQSLVIDISFDVPIR